MPSKKIAVFFLVLVLALVFLFWLQQQPSKQEAKKLALRTKIVRIQKGKKPRFLLLKTGQKQERTQLEVKAQLPPFLPLLFPKANFTKVQTEQQGEVQLTTANLTVFSSLAELEDSLINKLSKEWVLLRESSQSEIGFNLIFSQLETEKTLAFFAVKDEVSLKAEAKPLVKVSLLYAEKAKQRK
jgi:hypothetical protein